MSPLAHSGPSDPPLPRHVHLVGIGGAGMRSLADVLVQRGCRVTGSDASPEAAAALVRMGFDVHAGHDSDHLPPGTDLVVSSDAVARENPELQLAARRGIETLSYFQMLGRLMAGSHGIAVAGTHGKSTTAAMTAAILAAAGLDPTAIFGAVPIGAASGGRAGAGRLLLVEACEYRRNFLHLTPHSAAILNIEPDHFDCYASIAETEDAFTQFARRVPSAGYLLIPHGSGVGSRVATRLACTVETFGFDAAADWTARGMSAERGRCLFTLAHQSKPLCDIRLRIAGRHNVLNALAAAALAWREGVAPAVIAAALGSFAGLARRLEVLGPWRGAARIDDYAHHPTEVAAAVAAVRQMYPGRRLWCVFQPHQASRTARLLDELAANLHNAGRLFVAEIFRAREAAWQPGEVTAADLAARVRRNGGHVEAAHAPEEIVAELVHRLASGDVLLTMGAGDIRKVHDGLDERLREDRAAG